MCETRDAKEVIIKYVQNQSVKEDMQTLSRVTEETQDKKIAVKKCSNIYKLDPFVENVFCYNIVIFTPCAEFHLHVLLDSLYIQFRLYLRGT